jgi:thymidylate kinase
MDYWESGMHLALGNDLFDSFVRYQQQLIDEYDRMAGEFSFVVVDARPSVDTIQEALRAELRRYLGRDAPQATARRPAGRRRATRRP